MRVSSDLYLGAQTQTNNAAEVAALCEAFLWLLNEAPDDGTKPITIHYDSKYAANAVTGQSAVNENCILVNLAANFLKKLEQKREISWNHVFSHEKRGYVHGNVFAYKLAEKGAEGQVSPDSIR